MGGPCSVPLQARKSSPEGVHRVPPARNTRTEALLAAPANGAPHLERAAAGDARAASGDAVTPQGP